MAAIAYTESGRSVSLAIQIGSGGEGVIFNSPNDPLECAKIYTKPILPETIKKLSLMVTNPPSDPTYQVHKHRSICWPTAILYKDAFRNALAGFFMPKLDLKIFQKAFLYINKEYRTERFGGGFTWKHLVTAATNISSAVAAIHNQGYCIGDLNESNILIAPNALISIIDCDSFQVPDSVAGKTYRSPAGKGEYLAPELMGKNFKDVDRTVGTDSFALSVLLFQLLMQGTHPYQAKGRLVENAPNPEAKILLGHFPYSMRSREIAPPDHAPPFEILHPEIRKLFERCFTRGHGSPDQRPTAREWLSVLQTLSNSYRQCAANTNHIYFDHMRSCPWCQMKSRSGCDPFPSPVGQQVALDNSANLMDSLDKRLEYLQPYVVMAFADGILTSEEESQLIAFGNNLQIPQKEIEKLIQAEAARVRGKRGAAPGSAEISLSQTSFEFINIRQGTRLSGRYTITNTGGGTLTGTIRANKPWVILPQGSIDGTHHIQEHTFYLDTSKLTLGTRNHATIEIASNAGSVAIDISVAVEMEKTALSRFRKQMFWFGLLGGLIFGLLLFSLVPDVFTADTIEDIAKLVGLIAFVVVCYKAGWFKESPIIAFLAAIIGPLFVGYILKHISEGAYSGFVWAIVGSSFSFLSARRLLVARLANDTRTKIWVTISGLGLAAAIVLIGIAATHDLLPLEIERFIAATTSGDSRNQSAVQRGSPSFTSQSVIGGNWHGTYLEWDATHTIGTRETFDIHLTQSGTRLTGSIRETQSPTHGSRADLTGTIVGTHIQFLKKYRGNAAQISYWGTLAADGLHMNGSWSWGRLQGEWEATRGRTATQDQNKNPGSSDSQILQNENVTSYQDKTEQPRTQNTPGEAAGVWTDPATGLMWTKNDNGSDVNWQQAMDYCHSLQLADRTDWRLPTIDELQGIYDASINVPGQCCGGQSVTWHVKGNLQLSGGHWSSSQVTAYGQAMHFEFGSGERGAEVLGSRSNDRALCVRRSGE